MHVMLMFVLDLATYHVNISRISFIEDVNDWYSAKSHYAKCDVISGQNKKCKLKYFIENALQRKNIKPCITVLKVLSRNAIKNSFYRHFQHVRLR